MSEMWWTGVFNRDGHDSTGQRAWCRCGEWCYPSDPCPCCEKTALGDKTAAEVLAEVEALTARAEKAEAALERVREVCDDTPLAWQESASDEPVGCVFVPSVLAALGDPNE